MKTNYQSLFKPIKIGKLELKNRLVVPPVGTLFSGYDGHICGRLTEYHKVRAKGGWGLIIVEGVAISQQGKGGPKQYGIWDDSFIKEYKELTDAAHSEGAGMALQIMHCGRNTRPEITGGLQPVAPSALPDPIIRVVPKELTKEEIAGIVEDFGQAARRAKESGFDAVEIHGGHGYLVSGFMSAYANKRTDEYGNGLEGFLRFPVEIIKRIKAVCGKDYPVIFRISADEAVKGCRTIVESAGMSKRLAEEGADAIHVSVGVYESSYLTMAPATMKEGFNVKAASVIKKKVKVPVIAVGRINSPKLAEKIISSGKADMVAIGRQSVADPFWPLKVKENRIDEIVKCLSCNEGCLDTAWAANPITCVQNPLLGIDAGDIKKTDKPKKVLIAGGGPAGLEAAINAAIKGHKVIIYEMDVKAGGQINIAGVPPYKEILNEAVKSRLKIIKKINVDIITNKELTIDIIKKISPDVLIIATGSKTIVPDIGGVEQKNVITARDVLNGALIGDKVVVIGGGIVGCETADWLSEKGGDITIIEMLKSVARDISPAARFFLLKRLADKKVKIITKARVKEIAGNKIVVSREDSDTVIEQVDTIILATGAKSVNDLELKAKDIVAEIYVIGDARKPGKILDAVKQAAEVGRSL